MKSSSLLAAELFRLVYWGFHITPYRFDKLLAADLKKGIPGSNNLRWCFGHPRPPPIFSANPQKSETGKFNGGEKKQRLSRISILLASRGKTVCPTMTRTPA